MCGRGVGVGGGVDVTTSDGWLAGGGELSPALKADGQHGEEPKGAARQYLQDLLHGRVGSPIERLRQRVEQTAHGALYAAQWQQERLECLVVPYGTAHVGLHESCAERAERNAAEVAQEASHVACVALGVHEVSRGARDQHDHGGEHGGEYGPRVRAREVELEGQHDQIDGAEVVRPGVDGFVVLAEQRLDVVRVGSIGRTEALLNVRLAEERRRLRARATIGAHCLHSSRELLDARLDLLEELQTPAVELLAAQLDARPCVQPARLGCMAFAVVVVVVTVVIS